MKLLPHEVLCRYKKNERWYIWNQSHVGDFFKKKFHASMKFQAIVYDAVAVW